ncbi:DMT family transporter [Phaeobacter sp. QD34_3]|uniref:DMT family transporter n=1 Tax=unclassified Phaeobacter TaxID=2621772 RepID=UPI00237F8557|nr:MULTISPECIES: DMT family transporter [unclassified Phaeobacter]MDE4134189.1 DMT family transporter [Phaeobacter sp. QD34_3]MDE4137888.1 DMT family transporter [Phaeobacter sp. QD34_24]
MKRAFPALGSQTLGTPALSGALLVVVYTGFIASADGITKLLAGGYAPAQLYALSGAVVAGLCTLACLVARDRSAPARAAITAGLRTRCIRAMGVRSGATVLAALCFFYAFRLLPFAEVFIFIGLMPLLAGLMSAPILGERVRPVAWGALAVGSVGVICVFPGGISALSGGHGVALAGSVLGTLSITLSRYIGRYEQNVLAQVFYPNLALCLTMLPVLPFVWQPMPFADVAWALIYAGFLFGARWLLVAALRLLPAFAVTPLMNLQFVWMVVIGGLAFGEAVRPDTWAGAAAIMISGLYLVWDQMGVGRSSLLARLRLPQTDP